MTDKNQWTVTYAVVSAFLFQLYTSCAQWGHIISSFSRGFSACFIGLRLGQDQDYQLSRCGWIWGVHVPNLHNSQPAGWGADQTQNYAAWWNTILLSPFHHGAKSTDTTFWHGGSQKRTCAVLCQLNQGSCLLWGLMIWGWKHFLSGQSTTRYLWLKLELALEK